jgi:murein DD-endopeptidase MepM/ murein hydrolase activator NlpD
MLKAEPATDASDAKKEAPMRQLLRHAALAALACGSLAACESPHYPINESEAAGPAPLSTPRPKYAIDEDRPVDRAPAARPPAEEDAPASAPLAAPVAPVQSQPLPPPAPTAAQSRVVSHASLTRIATDPTPAGAPTAAPAPTPATTTVSTAPTTAAPQSSALPPAAPPAPAPAAATPAPAAPAADTSMTPQMVVHDQTVSTPPPAATAHVAARPSPRAADTEVAVRPARTTTIAGNVVDATGDVVENYEVQKGDHIDALARAFNTTRKTLLDVNNIRAPYVIHPGQILKVPVTKAYVARSGDTLTGVARRFGVSIGELAEMNHISQRSSLRPGQEIGLPSSMRDKGPQRAAGESAYAEAPTPRYVPPETHYTPPPSYAPPPAEGAEHHLTQVTPTGPSPSPERSGGYQAGPAQRPAAQAAPGLSDTQITQAARGRFVWPVRGDILEHFGPQGVGRRNDGVDIKAPQGADVKAAAGGEVVYAGDQVPGFGNLVLIKHADGWVTAYAHLNSVAVAMKQQVAQGEVVGTVGATGGVTQPELHFEVRYAPTQTEKAKPVDPTLVLPLG